MPYTIKETKEGFIPMLLDPKGSPTPLSEPKANITIAQWVIDNHYKGVKPTTETYHSYDPSGNKKIPLHD